MAGKVGSRFLRITTSRKADMLQIRIEDGGPGVPAHLRSRIFEPFFTTKEVGVGTGLGLSIVHSIMLDHKGQITYESSRYGGAAFVLQFPLVHAPNDEVPALEQEEPPPAAQTDSSKRAYILIVDDERSIAEMLGEMLSLLGHKPTLCHSAPQAIELLENQKFDLILSDFRMPAMDGQEFYERISAKYPALAQRFAFLSGDVVNDETQLFLKTSGRAHLAKPFRLEHVARMVSRMLDEANSPGENVVPVSFSESNPRTSSNELSTA
jgi:CheY-like chemotaxis protein